MQKMAALDYLRLNKWHKFLYNLKCFFCGIPGWFAAKFKALWQKIKAFGIWLFNDIVDIGRTFKNGSWKTKVSFFIMGFGSMAFGQWLRGILFFLFEAVFILYMCLAGGYWLSKFGTLGDIAGGMKYNEELDVTTWTAGDDSFKILLYGLLTIAFMVALVFTWRLNVKQCKTRRSW